MLSSSELRNVKDEHCQDQLAVGTVPLEVSTDRAASYPRVLDELLPQALHTVQQYSNNPVEADHGRLKARLRPMRGLKRHRSVRTVAAGHAFVQNLLRTLRHHDRAPHPRTARRCLQRACPLPLNPIQPRHASLI